MRAKVSTSATLITDAYKSYAGLARDYNHTTVKHSEGQYVVDKVFHTNNIENFWSLLKRGIIGIYHNVSPNICTDIAMSSVSVIIAEKSKTLPALNYP